MGKKSLWYSSPSGDILKFSKEKYSFALCTCRWLHNPDRIWISFELFDKQMIFGLKSNNFLFLILFIRIHKPVEHKSSERSHISVLRDVPVLFPLVFENVSNFSPLNLFLSTERSIRSTSQLRKERQSTS